MSERKWIPPSLSFWICWGFPAPEAMGVDEQTWQSSDQDGLNAILFERLTGRCLSDAVKALEWSHAADLRAMKLMPFEMMLQPAHAGDPGKRLLLDWIARKT
jgi:hypothetical protein